MGATFLCIGQMHVVHENMVDGSSVLRVSPLVIAVSERDMPGIEPGPLGWYTSQRPNHWATRSEAISWPGNSGVSPTIALL